MKLSDLDIDATEAAEIIAAEELFDVPFKLDEPDERRLGLGSWLFHHGYDDFAAYIPPSWSEDEIYDVCGGEQPILVESTWTGVTDEDIAKEEEAAAEMSRKLQWERAGQIAIERAELAKRGPGGGPRGDGDPDWEAARSQRWT